MQRTLLIDCDGVLADSEALGLLETTAYIQAQGINWNKEDLVALTGMRMDAVRQAFRQALEQAKGEMVCEQDAARVMDGFVEIRRSLKDKLREVPGATFLSSWLKDHGISRAIASSSQAFFLESKLKRIGLWDYYDPHIYSAEHVTHGKPAPDIFLHAAAALRRQPADCVVIEDSVNGVLAGVAAGMEVWGFTGGGHCFDGHDERLRRAGAVKTFPSHAALVATLEKAD